jgi:hypothetical protein
VANLTPSYIETKEGQFRAYCNILHISQGLACMHPLWCNLSGAEIAIKYPDDVTRLAS